LPPKCRVGCRESTPELSFDQSTEWWCWFFEQETQSQSFGGGSGGSHPLGCVKAGRKSENGGQWRSDKEPRLSVPLLFSLGHGSDQRWGKEGNLGEKGSKRVNRS